MVTGLETKLRKPRKPKAINYGLFSIEPEYQHSVQLTLYNCGGRFGDYSSIYLRPSDCRKYSEWLLKAADYLESK